MAIFRSVCRVVIERDDLLRPIIRAAQVTCVVLERKWNSLAEFEVRRLATELPDDDACAAIDLIDCVGVTCGDEVVPFGILVDAVDVEVVPGVGGVVTATSLAGVEGEIRFYEAGLALFV